MVTAEFLLDGDDLDGQMNWFLRADLLSMSGGLGAETEVDLAGPEIPL